MRPSTLGSAMIWLGGCGVLLADALRAMAIAITMKGFSVNAKLPHRNQVRNVAEKNLQNAVKKAIRANWHCQGRQLPHFPA